MTSLPTLYNLGDRVCRGWNDLHLGIYSLSPTGTKLDARGMWSYRSFVSQRGGRSSLNKWVWLQSFVTFHFLTTVTDRGRGSDMRIKWCVFTLASRFEKICWPSLNQMQKGRDGGIEFRMGKKSHPWWWWAQRFGVWRVITPLCRFLKHFPQMTTD